MMTSTRYGVNLGQENQLTLPEEVVRQLGLQPGDRLVVEIDDENPCRVEIRPVRRSYAGILDGVFGTDEEALAYVRAERASWDE
jgi:AbrB family looped-hinge helix DNA binding protein